jgi:ABC-type branched-subunit amino acid transport system substrate-binding protein
MRREGVRRLHVVDDGTIYGAGLSGLVRRRLAAAGIREVGFIRNADIGGDKLRRMARRTPAGADAVLYSANLAPGMIRQFHEGAPRPTLFVPDGASPALIEGVDGAESVVRMTSPLAGDGSAVAQAFARRFRKQFGTDPGPATYYSYEATKAALAAIEAAGAHGNRRDAVRRAFFALHRRDTVLGDYAFDRNGDSTLRGYGTYRVKDRQLIFTGVISAR